MLRIALRSALFLILAASASLLVYADMDRSSSFAARNGAAIFGVDNVAPGDLARTYAAAATATTTEDKIRVFIMPGHEPNYGGAEYGSLKERDMAVVLGERLAEFLRTDSHYEVVLGRDSEGWNPALVDYFADNKAGIAGWMESQKRIMRSLLKDGSFEPTEDPVPHQAAPDDVAFRLYGINKWIGEQSFDIAVHIHFNDYGSRANGSPGKFTGFVVYVPDKQYSNSAAAKLIGDSLKKRLDLFLVESDAKKEAGGVVEDQSLIALGSNNTADAPSLLIEYGYIYEPQFQNKAARAALLKEYAYQTYLGLQDFFNTDTPPVPYEADILPYDWAADLERGASGPDVLALQFALANNRFYPPQGKTLRDCPITGSFGACTEGALIAFQKRYEIQGEDGRAGNKTRNLLNTMFR